jgi:hypothetical protein
MTFAQVQGNTEQTLAQFRKLSVDQKLALLWILKVKNSTILYNTSG